MTTAPMPEEAPRARRSQRERREASRAAILAAAREEFLEKEFPSVTLEGIAVRAGLTRGAVYHQFADKKELFTEVVQGEAVSVRGVIGAQMAAQDHPIERLQVGCALYLDLITDVRILRMIHIDYPAACGPDRWALESPWLGDVERMLQEATDRALIRPIPIRAMARLILAFIREMVVAYVSANDRRGVRDEMMASLESLLDGLKCGRGPAGSSGE